MFRTVWSFSQKLKKKSGAPKHLISSCVNILLILSKPTIGFKFLKSFQELKKVGSQKKSLLKLSHGQFG